MADNLRGLAYKDYKAGLSPAEIEKKHNGAIKADTVRKWVRRHWKKNTPGGTGQDKKTGQQDRTKKAPSTPQEVDKIISDALEETEGLTQKQKDFCRYFIRNRNATQAYLKAYGCSYDTANSEGPGLLVNPRIRDELRRLREIKNAALGGLCGDDVVELHMRIAFADITDYVDFESKTEPVLKDGVPLLTFDPDTGEAQELHRNVNTVLLRNSSEVDGTLLSEVSEGREGVKVKLTDRQRSLAFLERYFELNPMDRHKMAYDNAKLAKETNDEVISDWLGDVLDE